MAGPGSRDQTASARSAEPARPVRRTRQALKVQRAAEAANFTADEPSASPQPTYDVIEVAAKNPAANDRFTPPARRFAAPRGRDEVISSPASNDFDPDTIELDIPTPAGGSTISPNRQPRESVGGQEYATDDARFTAQKAQEVIYSLTAGAQQDDGNQVDEDEYVSSSSEPEQPIQRRPTVPRRTHFDDAHASNEMTIGVVTGLGRNPQARESRPWADNSGTTPSHYRRSIQNPSEYLSDARASLPMPNTPRRSNQSPSGGPQHRISQANLLKRQRTIDEKEEEENEEEEDGEFETNTRPAKQRVTGRENEEKLDSSRGFVPPPPEPLMDDRQSAASRAKSANGAEDDHSEHNEEAGARVDNGDINAQDAIEVSVKARETALKYRSVTKKPQSRSPWTAGDVAKLIAAISKHGCSWTVLESDLKTLSTPRNQQQIRDKARNIKVDFLLGDVPLPHGFNGIALGKKEREKVISCERNPDREEADVDDSGNATNCRYTR